MALLPRSWWLAVLAVELYLILVSLLVWVRMRSEPDVAVRAGRTAILFWVGGSTALGLCFAAFAAPTQWSQGAALGGACLLFLTLIVIARRSFR